MSTAAAMVSLCGVAPLAAILIPLLLPVLEHDAHLTPTQTGLLAAADLSGACLATLSAPAWLALVGSRRGAALGMVTLVLSSVLAAFAHTAWPLLALRVISGIGLGLVLSSAVPLVAMSTRPARLISATQVLQLLVAALALQGAGWLLARGGAGPILLIVAGLTFAATPLVFLLPDRPATAQALPTLQELQPAGRALIAILVYFAALALLTNYAGNLGLQQHLSLGSISTALALGNLGALPGSLVALAVNDPARRSWLLVAATVAQCAAVLAMMGLSSALAFTAGFFVVQICATAIAPFQVAALVEYDSTGRGIEGLAAMQSLGQALGPLVGGFFISATRVDGAYLFGLVCVLLSAALIVSPAALRGRLPAPPATQ